MSTVVIAFRTPGTPPPKEPPIYIPGLPDADGPEAADEDELSADILRFRMPAKATAIPHHELIRRVRMLRRLAAEWGVDDFVVATEPRSAP